MMYALRILAALILFAAAVHALSINEIMYNPPGNDVRREWIEIYNNDTVSKNLSEFKLAESGTNHKINFANGSEIINASDFAVIASDNASFMNEWPGFSGNLFESYFSLPNSGEEIDLKDSSLNIIDSFTYTNSTGGAGNGNTLCRYPEGNATLSECAATPGATNNLSIPANNTNTTQNSSSTNSTCDLTLSISTPLDIINSGQQLNYNLTVNDILCSNVRHDTTIDYTIEDLFGNPASSFPANTTQRNISCSKTVGRQWTPPNVIGSEAYLIIANISSTGCNETDSTNNNASKMIVVMGTPQSTASSVSIDSIDVGSDNTIQYGEAGEVSLTVYKGKTTQTAVDVYVKDAVGNKLSEVTNFNLNTQFSTYSLNVPIQMKSNCDSSLQQGTQTLVADGLGIIQTAPINVSGISSSSCRTTTVTVSPGGGGGSSSSLKQTQTQYTKYELVDYKNPVTVGEEFSVRVRITNNYTISKNFTVYSYVYDGNNPVSTGYDSSGNVRSTYTANQKSLDVPAGFSSVAELKNIVEDGTLPGKYNLRIRFRLDGKDTDITQQIDVRESPAPLKEETNQRIPIRTENATDNETAAKVPSMKSSRVTGFASTRPSLVSIGRIIFSPWTFIFEILLPGQTR